MTDCTFDVTTLDLLKLYYHTGLVPAGVIEMRQAWFFNDLKTAYSPLPSWWHDVTVQYYPQLLPEDPLDKAEGLPSVLGDSVR